MNWNVHFEIDIPNSAHVIITWYMLSRFFCYFVILKPRMWLGHHHHYSDVIMSPMASQIMGVSIVYSTICSGADQSKHHSSASLAFVNGIHWWQVNFSHKGSVTRQMFSFDDVIMIVLKPYRIWWCGWILKDHLWSTLPRKLVQVYINRHCTLMKVYRNLC